MVRAFLIIMVVACCAIAGLASPGRGQDNDELGAASDSTAADTTAAAADTLEADSTVVVRKLDVVPGFHPQYTSSYRVNRQSRAWAQTFTMNEQMGPILVSNQTSMTINEDLNRNRNERVGSTGAAAEMNFGGGLWAGLKAQMLRSTVAEQRSESEDTSTSADLTATYANAVGPLKGDFRVALGVMRNDVYGQLLLTPLRRPTEGTPADSSRVDSTRAEGTNREFAGTLTYKPMKALRSTVIYRTRTSNLDSRAYTFFRGRGENDTIEVAPTDDSNWSTESSTHYTMTPTTSLSLDLKSTFARNHRYVVGADFTGTETQTREDRSANMSASTILPIVRASLSSSVFMRASSQEFARQRDPNSKSDQQGFSLNVTKTLPFAIEGTGTFSADLRENTFEVERFTPNDVRTRQFGLTLKREVNQRVGIGLTNTVSLISYFYHPKADSTGATPALQDRDDYRHLVDLSVKYRPGPKFDTGLSVQRTKTATVNIDEESSGNNAENERWLVRATLTYFWSDDTQISQQYSIAADYTALTFRGDQNSLTRETKVTTLISSQISSRTRLELGHDFRFRDTGNYSGTPRLYGRALTDTQQDLQATTRYRIFEGLSVSLRQRMEARRFKSLVTGAVSKNLRLELVEGFNYGHGFKSGLSVDADFNRTDRYLEQPDPGRPDGLKIQKEKFWVIQASLSKRF